MSKICQSCNRYYFSYWYSNLFELEPENLCMPCRTKWRKQAKENCNAYNRQDLMNLMTISSDCECNCPLSGQSVYRVAKYVISYHHDVACAVKLCQVAAKVWEEYTRRACMSGSRLTMAAGLHYAVGILTGARRTQFKLGRWYFTTEATVRNRYNQIRKVVDLHECYSQVNQNR